jgi:hypothetical protein
MTFNPTTFLPPVLAVGQGDSSNGRQQIGSGLVTHRGIIDSNSFRAQGRLYPQSGAGVEVQYDQTAKGGFVISYDRDVAAYTDLNIGAKNITLTAQGGGKVSLPAGTAQNTSTARIIQTWNIPAVGGWYESPLQINLAVTAGNQVRVEGCGTFTHAVAGAIIYVGLGLDGALQLDSLMCPQVSLAGGVAGWAFTCYLGGQITTTATHRFSVMLYTNAAGPPSGFWNGAYQYLAVTEQRA